MFAGSCTNKNARPLQAGRFLSPEIRTDWLASLLARLQAQGLLVSETQALGQLVEQITMTLLFSLDYQRILGREGEVRLVIYQIMMLVAPHLLASMKAATEQMAMEYLEDQ